MVVMKRATIDLSNCTEEDLIFSNCVCSSFKIQVPDGVTLSVQGKDRNAADWITLSHIDSDFNVGKEINKMGIYSYAIDIVDKIKLVPITTSGIIVCSLIK